jgi:hypothetical protein
MNSKERPAVTNIGADVVIPIVFPDYLIAVNTPPIKVNLPDVIPGFDFFPDVLIIPGTNNKLPQLGHAGVLFLNGSIGITKYYEYGRYDRANLGLTRRIPVSDVLIGKNGKPTAETLLKTLKQISTEAGQGGRIVAAYIEVPGKYDEMLRYVTTQALENSNPKREPYDLTRHSCMHFSQAVVQAAGIKTPPIFDPRPINFIEEMRAKFPPLDFSPPQTLIIKGVEGF